MSLPLSLADKTYLRLPNGMSIQQDVNGHMGIFNQANVEVAFFDKKDPNLCLHFISQSAGGSNPDWAIGIDPVGSGEELSFYLNGLQVAYLQTSEAGSGLAGGLAVYDRYVVYTGKLRGAGYQNLRPLTMGLVQDALIQTDSQATPAFYFGQGIGNNVFGDINNGVSTYLFGSALSIRPRVTSYNNITTAGLGVPALYGVDNRSGVTSADGAPITVYAVPAGANQLYRITADIFATAYTSGTATYTITWTENAVTRTLTVTATALNTLGTGTDLINPDASTSITAQLTGVFTATVKVAAVVEQLA